MAIDPATGNGRDRENPVPCPAERTCQRVRLCHLPWTPTVPHRRHQPNGVRGSRRTPGSPTTRSSCDVRDHSHSSPDAQPVEQDLRMHGRRPVQRTHVSSLGRWADVCAASAQLAGICGRRRSHKPTRDGGRHPASRISDPHDQRVATRPRLDAGLERRKGSTTFVLAPRSIRVATTRIPRAPQSIILSHRNG